jgi:hypothetical protein
VTRLGRRFPVHRGYNPALFGAPVAFDSVGVGNFYMNTSGACNWNHTLGPNANFLVALINLFFTGGGVGMSSGGVGYPNLPVSNTYNTIAPWTAYDEIWWMMNPAVGTQLQSFNATGGSTYVSGQSLAYKNVGGVLTTAFAASTSITIPSVPGGMVVAMFGGWASGAGGEGWGTFSPNFTQRGTAGGGEPLMVGDTPGVQGAVTISHSNNWGDGSAAAAISLLPRIPQPML